MTNQIKGKEFMFTGTLKVPRHEAQALVEQLGGTAGSSLGKGTDFLIVGTDQEGKSSKFIRAGLLGVTRVDEDYFWRMVEEAQAEVVVKPEEEEVLLTKEELDNIWDIPLDKWKQVFEKNPNLSVLLPAGLEELVEMPRLPNKTDMSYNSGDRVLEMVEANPWLKEVVNLEKKVCPNCEWTVPYSVNPGSWYCFRCRIYFPRESSRHVCWDWKDTEIEVAGGKYLACKLCGTVKFCGNEEIVRTEEIDRSWINSLEFLIAHSGSLHRDVVYTEPAGTVLSEQELQSLRTRWEANLQRSSERQAQKLARKEQKAQETFQAFLEQRSKA